MNHLLGLLQYNSFDALITILLFHEIKHASIFRHYYNYFTIFFNNISNYTLILKIVISKKLTLYPRSLLTFSKNKYNNNKFYNEECLQVDFKRRLFTSVCMYLTLNYILTRFFYLFYT